MGDRTCWYHSNEANFVEVLNGADIDAKCGTAFFSLEVGLVSAEDAQNVSRSCSRLAC